MKQKNYNITLTGEMKTLHIDTVTAGHYMNIPAVPAEESSTTQRRAAWPGELSPAALQTQGSSQGLWGLPLGGGLHYPGSGSRWNPGNSTIAAARRALRSQAVVQTQPYQRYHPWHLLRHFPCHAYTHRMHSVASGPAYNTAFYSCQIGERQGAGQGGGETSQAMLQRTGEIV